MTKLTTKTFRNILLIKPSSLGDCLHALPVLNALRRVMPQAKITWLINSQYSDILKNHPSLDNLILFNRQIFRPQRLGVSSVKEVLGLYRKLRAERFDLVIDLQGLLRSALMSQATAAPVRLGLSDAREWAELFYTQRVELKPTDTHAVDRYLRTLEVLGISSAKRDFSLGIDQKALTQVNGMLSSIGLRAAEPFVLVIPGARWPSKRWPAERFAALIDRIQSQLHIACLLAGAADETRLSRKVAGLCESKPLDLTGQTSLAQLAALISRCELVLGHDSGTIHLAVALDKPLVCLIGPTDAKRTGPYRREDSIITAQVPCAPCRRSVCPDNQCMTQISVESVFEKIKSLLAAKDRS